MLADFIESKISQYTNDSGYSDEWAWDGLRQDFAKTLLIDLPFDDDDLSGITQEALFEKTLEAAKKQYQRREEQLGEKLMRQIERLAMLRVIDERWREHLYEMDQLKEGIGLRAYGQKNPLLEYKSEGFRMFTEMLDMINTQVIDLIFNAPIQREPVLPGRRVPVRMTAVHDSAEGMALASISQQADVSGPSSPQPQRGKKQPVVVGEKTGRNEPCPCGSGKKYKKCHGAL